MPSDAADPNNREDVTQILLSVICGVLSFGASGPWKQRSGEGYERCCGANAEHGLHAPWTVSTTASNERVALAKRPQWNMFSRSRLLLSDAPISSTSDLRLITDHRDLVFHFFMFWLLESTDDCKTYRETLRCCNVAIAPLRHLPWHFIVSLVAAL